MESFSDYTISAAAGVLLSLAFSYFPGLRTWYATLHEDWKRVVMLAALAIVTAGVYMLSCPLGWYSLVTCDKAGVIKLIESFVAALIGNQAAYPISIKATDVRSIKEARG